MKINLKQAPRQLEKDDHIPDGASEANSQRQRSWKDDPPDPSNEIIPSHSPRIMDFEALERTMAIKIKTTGQSTSTKAQVLDSQTVRKSAGAAAMVVEYPQSDQPIHWEPPAFQRSEEKTEYSEPIHQE